MCPTGNCPVITCFSVLWTTGGYGSENGTPLHSLKHFKTTVLCCQDLQCSRPLSGVWTLLQQCPYALCLALPWPTAPSPAWLAAHELSVRGYGLGCHYRWKSGLLLSPGRHFGAHSGLLHCAPRNNCTTCTLGEPWVSGIPSGTCPKERAHLAFPWWAPGICHLATISHQNIFKNHGGRWAISCLYAVRIQTYGDPSWWSKVRRNTVFVLFWVHKQQGEILHAKSKKDGYAAHQRGKILNPAKGLFLCLHLQQCQEYSKDK